MRLVHFYHPESGVRLGVQLDETVHDVSGTFSTLAEWLMYSAGRVPEAIDELRAAAEASQIRFPVARFENPPDFTTTHWLPPVDVQEIWAAGVTYVRSRQARQEESSDGGDVYARVYDAPRPELFFKAQGEKAVGHLDEVGIRADASWSVPEPELALVLNSALEVVGFTAGNDMSSRDIEGANPLYLPQAKVYTASCAVGDGILLEPSTTWPQTTIRLTIERAGVHVVDEHISTSQIHRSLTELVDYLGRSTEFPYGVVLLTGTGIVPPGDFTLQAGDEITVAIDGIATLRNRVRVV